MSSFFVLVLSMVNGIGESANDDEHVDTIDDAMVVNIHGSDNSNNTQQTN